MLKFAAQVLATHTKIHRMHIGELAAQPFNWMPNHGKDVAPPVSLCQPRLPVWWYVPKRTGATCFVADPVALPLAQGQGRSATAPPAALEGRR